MKIDYRVWRWLCVIADAQAEGMKSSKFVVNEFALDMMEKMIYV